MVETMMTADQVGGSQAAMFVVWTTAVVVVLGMMTHPVLFARAIVAIVGTVVGLILRIGAILMAILLWGIRRGLRTGVSAPPRPPAAPVIPPHRQVRYDPRHLRDERR